MMAGVRPRRRNKFRDTTLNDAPATLYAGEPIDVHCRSGQGISFLAAAWIALRSACSNHWYLKAWNSALRFFARQSPSRCIPKQGYDLKRL